MITKTELQQELMNLILTLQWSKTDLHQDHNIYYELAAAYRALDQFTLENDINICDADRWI